jgi:hypothetical protein
MAVIIFGGTHGRDVVHTDATAGHQNTDETWALDIRSATWYRAAQASQKPARRSFPADAGGCGGILQDHAGNDWLIIFSGSRPGIRDNETWMLGPLGAADGCSAWRWFEIQADGRAQSPARPSPRFHHSLTVLREPSLNRSRNALLLYGGHNFRIEPMDEAHVLTLSHVDLVVDDSRAGDPQLIGLDHTGWTDWTAADDGEGPAERARHTAVFWPARGAVIVLGGEVEGSYQERTVWASRGPFIDGHAEWEQLDDLPPPAASYQGDPFAPRCDMAAVALSCGKLLVDVRDHPQQQEPRFFVLDRQLSSTWIECSVIGAVPKGVPRNAWRFVRAAADTVLLWGGHDASRCNQFGDPQYGSFLAPHESRVARLLPSDGGGPPVLRIGCCTGGQPPALEESAAFFERRPREEDCTVLLHRLVSRAELNGRFGTLRNTRSVVNGRYAVEADGKDLAIRPDNLLPATCTAPSTLAWCDELQLAVELHDDVRVDGVNGWSMRVNYMRLY